MNLKSRAYAAFPGLALGGGGLPKATLREPHRKWNHFPERRIPIARIRVDSVVGFSPSKAAAPSGP